MAQSMQVDEDMVEVPPAECSSLFSVCLPQCSYFFQNVRNIENQHAFSKRGKSLQVCEYDGVNRQIGTIDLYHVKMVVLPGQGEVLIVGGSEDAECTRLTDRVIGVDKTGKTKARKPICMPRAKLGLAVGELCSEANAQFRKTFVFAFGGVDHADNSLKQCEKYNVKANIWQSMPNLNIARRNASG